MAKENSVARTEDQLNASPMKHADDIAVLLATVWGLCSNQSSYATHVPPHSELVCAQSPGVVDNAETSLCLVMCWLSLLATLELCTTHLQKVRSLLKRLHPCHCQVLHAQELEHEVCRSPPPPRRMSFFLCRRGFLQQVIPCVRLFPDELRCDCILWIPSEFCGLSRLVGDNDRISKPSFQLLSVSTSDLSSCPSSR